MALAASPHATRLRRLSLTRQDIGLEGVQALADAPGLPQLRELELSFNPLGNAGCKALVRGQLELERLHLSGCQITFSGVVALTRSTTLRKLRELGLSHNTLGDSSATALASSPLLAGLERLDVSHTELTPDGLAVLYASQHFPLGMKVVHAPLPAPTTRTEQPQRTPLFKALDLLEYLIRVGKIEVEPELDAAELAESFVRVLRSARNSRRAGEQIADWLVEQPGVVELYATDRELAAFARM